MTEAFKAAPSVVPPSYRGREQAWIKHQLLESYLEKLMLIVGMAAKRQGTIEICYVDFFSGPWGTSELESTSIAVSLRTMAKCRQKLAELGVTASMRALYIERDDEAFGNLERYLLIRRELFMRPHRRHACRQSTSGPALACSPTSSCVLSPPRAAWPWFAPEPCCQSHASNRH